MITYEEWHKLQSQIEARARSIWSIYAQKYEIYRSEDYYLDGINIEDGAVFRAYIGGYDETECLDTKLLFVTDEDLTTFFDEDISRIKREKEEKEAKEKQERDELVEKVERKQLALLKAKYEHISRDNQS